MATIRQLIDYLHQFHKAAEIEVVCDEADVVMEMFIALDWAIQSIDEFNKPPRDEAHA
jgi:hypothetical protein